MKKTRLMPILSACIAFCLITACQKIEPVTDAPILNTPIPHNSGTASPLPEKITDNHSERENAYISITYGRDNSDTTTGREIVYYTFDLDTERLKEECVIPFDSGYATGVVSLYDSIIYYSQRSDSSNPHSQDNLCSYDIKRGKSIALETENRSYNDITLIDPDTLLVAAVTFEHTITPARYGLSDKTFTYTADVNNEPFALYTSGPQPFNYNYKFQKLVQVYYNLEEKYLEEYWTSPFQLAIDKYIALLPLDLAKNPDEVFSIPLKITSDIRWATQISEHVLLVHIKQENLTDEDERLSSYYLLKFIDGKTMFEPVDNPFIKAVNVKNCMTFDGGNTYYCIGDYIDYVNGSRKIESGLFIYNCSANEITPILLNDEVEGGHVINFSVVAKANH